MSGRSVSSRSVGKLAAVLVVVLAAEALPAAEFVPLQQYRSENDSLFPEFGFEGTLRIEDFEDGFINTPGLMLQASNPLTSGQPRVQEGYSVLSDVEAGGVGRALESSHISCALSFPPICTATISFRFDPEELGRLPTYVGFVWTNAVQAESQLRAPFARVTVVDAFGESNATLINELPDVDHLEDAHQDDTLISFINDAGIQQLDIMVATDGTGLGGHLAIDHVQFGIAAMAGDADVDGDVDFADFMRLAAAFGQPAGWGGGDFDLNRTTEFPDFLKLASNFGAGDTSQANRTPASAAVPEPLGAGPLGFPLGFLVLLLLGRRRRVSAGDC